MSVQDTFKGAKSGLAFLFAYQNTVAREIGTEQAMALNRKMVEAMGTAQGKALSRQVDDETPPEVAAAVVGRFLEQALGIRSDLVERTEQKAVIEAGRCPIYEAARALGMEDAAIEALCRGGSIPYMDAIVRQLNPDLGYELSQFRPAADASCIETIVADRQ
ncbi:MAG: L-2-amino-thiazoline-4-carboxylic acid hydrolase [Anaerolineae bacterium]|nr:L-2-amino-thiazoline-4-carboxylic acid hydrolase [Anaerolineae bacterium]